MARRLRLRLTARANDGLPLIGSVENLRRHIESAPVWLYSEPVKIRVGARLLECGVQPAVANGQVRLLLTDPDSDCPAWDFDVEKVIAGPTRGLQFFGGERVEVELLPASVAREVEEVEEEVVAAAPSVQPIAPAPPTLPEKSARKCPACGAEIERNKIGMVCFNCAAELPDALAVPLVVGVCLWNKWERLADFQRERISSVFRRVERGRRFTKQINLTDRYLLLIVAETDDASSMAELKGLAELLEKLEAGAVFNDDYEIREVWRMLKERYGSNVWYVPQ